MTTDSAGSSVPVPFLNPLSGGGKVERCHLVDAARARGIKPVVLRRGDDVASLARNAATQGATMTGTAGGGRLPGETRGRGVRARPSLCVRSGRDEEPLRTRSWPGSQGRRRGLGRLLQWTRAAHRLGDGERSSVRQQHLARVLRRGRAVEGVPELQVPAGDRDASNTPGPGAAPFDLRLADPTGTRYSTFQLLLVSNNRYAIDLRDFHGTRAGINHGLLGVVVITAPTPIPLVREWTTPDLWVGSAIVAGLDDEAMTFEPPLVVASLPRALRARLPRRYHDRNLFARHLVASPARGVVGLRVPPEAQ